MSLIEHPVLISVRQEQLLGIVSQSDKISDVGVLIVVGGPQYRVGSHRQFVLLARDLTLAGYPVMRFDYGGMGDSDGEARGFEAVGDDIRAAVDAFVKFCPTLKRVVLWGLCDGASAALLYWDQFADIRVAGFVALNPWVRSEATLAQTRIKHYYGQRLLQADFWKRLVTGRVGIVSSAQDYLRSFLAANKGTKNGKSSEVLTFQQRMVRALSSFSGPVLVVLSENDYTAKEFLQYAHEEKTLSASLNKSNVVVETVPDADHTFSSHQWRQAVSQSTRRYLRALECA